MLVGSATATTILGAAVGAGVHVMRSGGGGVAGLGRQAARSRRAARKLKPPAPFPRQAKGFTLRTIRFIRAIR